MDSWTKPLQKFIETLYLRLKKEFEYDPQIKAKLEKIPDFLKFLDALEKVNARISEDEFPLGDLFQFGDLGEGTTDSGLPDSPDMHKIFSSDLAMGNDPRFSFQKQIRDSILPVMSKEESLGKPARKSEESNPQKDSPGAKGGELDDLKQQLLALQSQISTFQKTMTEVTRSQIDLKDSLFEDRRTRLEPVKEVEVVPVVKDEFLECFKDSGLSPGEFEQCLGYVKQVNQFLHTEEKAPRQSFGQVQLKSNGKLKEELYGDVSLGGSEDELKILTAIELYISNNRLVDAMKLIKWRKKIIKLAEMNGWDVASIIASRTIGKLDVDATDIIMSNLCLMQKMENIVGFGGDELSGEEDEE